MKRNLPICVLLFFSILKVDAQDIHYSQYNEAPLLLNPAMAGTLRNPVRICLNYRNQWPTIGNSYNTISASLDLPITYNSTSLRPRPYLGAGVYAFRDQAGEGKLGTTLAGIAVSGVVPMSENHKMSAGIQTGFGQRSGDVNKLTWGSQFVNNGFKADNPSGEFDNLTSPAYADVSMGFYYQFSNVAERFLQDDVVKVNAGIALYHVNRPQTTFTDMSVQRIAKKTVYMINAQYDFPTTKYSLLPSFVYWKQGPYTETIYGMLFKIRVQEASKFTGLNEQTSIAVGISYRNKDAFILEGHYQVSAYTIGLSYDANISKLVESSKSVGAIELALKYSPGRKTFKGN